MARVLSHLHSIMRGSIAGVTYFANQYHQILIRARTAPVQPNTPQQTLIRSAMTGANDGWIQLTTGEHTAWANYAMLTQWPGPLGPYTITGRLCYIAMKALRLFITTAGYAIPSGPDTAPAPLTGFYNLKNVSCAAFVVPGQTGIAVSLATEVAQDACVLYELSPPMPPTRFRFKGPWDTSLNQAHIHVKNTVPIINFVNLAPDSAYFVRVKAVADDAPGRVSPEFIIRCLSVTNP